MGTVVLVNNSGKTFAKVELLRGANASAPNDTETKQGVGAGEVARAEGKLCYRRSLNPSDANSGMPPNWTCKSHTVPGTTTIELS